MAERRGRSPDYPPRQAPDTSRRGSPTGYVDGLGPGYIDDPRYMNGPRQMPGPQYMDDPRYMNPRYMYGPRYIEPGYADYRDQQYGGGHGHAHKYQQNHNPNFDPDCSICNPDDEDLGCTCPPVIKKPVLIPSPIYIPVPEPEHPPMYPHPHGFNGYGPGMGSPYSMYGGGPGFPGYAPEYGNGIGYPGGAPGWGGYGGMNQPSERGWVPNNGSSSRYEQYGRGSQRYGNTYSSSYGNTFESRPQQSRGRSPPGASRQRRQFNSRNSLQRKVDH